MSKKGNEPPPPPPPPPPENGDAEKQWDKVAYNVVFDMLKGLTLGILGAILISNKKAAFASGIAFGAGQGYADFLQEFKYNEEEREAIKKAQEEEEKKKQKEEEKNKAKEEDKKKDDKKKDDKKK